MMDLWRSSTAPIEQGGIAHFTTNKRMDELCAMFKFLEAIPTQASNLHQFQSHGLFLWELWKSKSKFCCYVFTSPECFCNAVSACCEVRPNEIISIAQVPVRFMMVEASSYVGFYDFMVVDGGWWWLMVVDGGWWWLMVVDGGWWWLMVVDGGWWWLMIGWPSATTRVPERGICKAPVGTHLAAMAQVMAYGPTKCSRKLPPYVVIHIVIHIVIIFNHPEMVVNNCEIQARLFEVVFPKAKHPHARKTRAWRILSCRASKVKSCESWVAGWLDLCHIVPQVLYIYMIYIYMNVYVYVYVYVCICMYMYVYVCICMYMYVYVCICMCMCMYVCICMYVCMYVYVCICMYMYVYVCICMYMYVYVCICMYMYVYVCICMYMYVYVCMYMYVCICMYVYVCMYVSLCLFVCLYVCMFVCMIVCLYVCFVLYVCMSVCMYVCMCVWRVSRAKSPKTWPKFNEHLWHQIIHWWDFQIYYETAIFIDPSARSRPREPLSGSQDPGNGSISSTRMACTIVHPPMENDINWY